MGLNCEVQLRAATHVPEWFEMEGKLSVMFQTHEPVNKHTTEGGKYTSPKPIFITF